MSERDPAIFLRGVGKRFGWTWALRGLDLQVPSGSLLALVGPNGAGKTTLLRLLATHIRPTRGEVKVLGRPVVEDEEEVRRSLAFLPPRGYLYDELTALENLRFASMMSGISRDEDALRRILERVSLGPVADHRVAGFSSGMRKRLAVARLLLRQVEVVLLDEPYAGLDADGIELVDRLVADLHEAGKTVVVASHQWGSSLQAADRVVALQDGRIGWEGTPADHAREQGGSEAAAPGDGSPGPGG